MNDPTLLAHYLTGLDAFLATGSAQALATAQALGAATVPEPGAAPDLAALLAGHHASLPASPQLTARAAAYLAAYLAPSFTALAALSEQRRALEGLPQVLLENVPAVVYVTAAGGKAAEFLFVGPQAEAVLGYPPGAWLADDRLWLERLEPDDRPRVLGEEAAALVAGAPFVSEYRFRARDGRTVWLHDEASAVRDAGGAIRFWRGVLFDITERKQAEQRAAADERDRLARELHDSATQTVMAAAILARTIPRLWQRDARQGEAALAELGELMQTALAEMRTLLLELRPAALTQTPLDDLLRQLAASLRSRSRTELALALCPLQPLPPDVQIAFYRTAQEALNNMIKHAHAGRAWLRLEQQGAQLTLTISDDGRGYAPEAAPAGRFGLRFMRERAEAIGGQLAVASQPGRGVQVRLTWPAPEEELPCPE